MEPARRPRIHCFKRGNGIAVMVRNQDSHCDIYGVWGLLYRSRRGRGGEQVAGSGLEVWREAGAVGVSLGQTQP